jgi:hypothetical protein
MIFFQISEKEAFTSWMPLKSQKKDQELTIGIHVNPSWTKKNSSLPLRALKCLRPMVFKIMIEQNAGHSSHFSDRDTARPVAFITPEKAELYKADKILKICPAYGRRNRLYQTGNNHFQI